MNFNKHFELKDKHAFLSPSKYHWVNYDEAKLEENYSKYQAKEKGVRLHAHACESILLGIDLPKRNKTLNLYINDAIGFMMTPEQPLKYSDNCFGTADAISFRKNMLRIHDFKSGETKSSMKQLEIYAALFCLEYDVNPNDIQIELRIYQLDCVLIHNPDKEDILYIMQKIISSDKHINEMKAEV